MNICDTTKGAFFVSKFQQSIPQFQPFLPSWEYLDSNRTKGRSIIILTDTPVINLGWLN